MLQNLKNILLNIRKERENQNNSSFLSRDESTAKQLRAIAILDLPFKTDPESITKARHHVIGNLGKINIKITPTIADASELQLSYERHQINPTHKDTIGHWINEIPNKYTQYRRGRFVEKILENPIFGKSGLLRFVYENKSLPITGEMFTKNLPLNLLLLCIDKIVEQEGLSPKTKDTYHSCATSLYKFIENPFKPCPPFIPKYNPQFDLYEIAKFFEFIETLALKSTVIK